MKMTADEILEMYNKDRSKEGMQMIADLNGCSIKEVGEFLKEQAVCKPKKKPGRPKKQKNPSTENVLKDKDENLTNIDVSVPVKKRPRSYIIPDCVVDITKLKIEEYKRLAKFHEQKAEELYLIVNECEDFLNGGTFNGSENSI